MQNKIFKFPNGVTLDLSGIKEEPCKVFIKGGYISRITDRLRKEEIKRVLKNWLSSNPHCSYNGELLISEDVDKQTRKFIQECYKEVKEEL